MTAARSRFPDRRIVLLFQPHTEARTRYLFNEFRGCFSSADAVYVLETYDARVTGVEGASARELSEAIETPVAQYVASHDAARDALVRDLRPGDVLFTMGAGDVDHVGTMVLESLRSAA